MNDDRSRKSLTERAAAALMAGTSITVLSVALTSPSDLPNVLTGMAALLVILKELRP
jgi:hypothetical protein